MVAPVSDCGFGPARHAELMLLLEVAGMLKPGNVGHRRDLSDLHFEQFLMDAVGAVTGLELAESGAPVGEAFEEAVAGMSRQDGGSTQFGCLLLLAPLVQAAADDDRDLSPAGATAVAESTTVADAVGFYRAFGHVNVAVGDVPDDAPDLGVRRGGDATEALRNRGCTLYDVMALSADRDANACEWTGGFARTFRAAEAALADDGLVTDRVARAFLDLLAEELDTLATTDHGETVARDVMDHAAAVLDLAEVEKLADEFVAEGINPSTTADIVCAATFAALERGVPL